MVLYFIATVFLSAMLLFSVQPMVAKTLLPVFGGSSSVWTTCMLFYQTVLLLGYLYAHVVMNRIPKKVQLIGHTAMLVVALVAGVVFDSPVPPPSSEFPPTLWLLFQLGLVSGLPFFMISSAGPLIQGWFARTGHPRAHDPYFLYAASNAGSLIGLLAYPLIIEPTIGLDTQRQLWLIGFGLFIAFTVGAILFTKNAGDADPKSKAKKNSEPEPDELISWKRRAKWIFYAFVPSTMLLGVTSHLAMDIASFPLLWILPLVVYLITMIVAFAVDQSKLIEKLKRPLVVAVIASVILALSSGFEAYAPIVAMVISQLFLLFLVGLMGHSKLAHDRPSASRLTEFYLLMSIGGALGGFFNGIIAPLIFVMTTEYQVGLLCSLGLLTWQKLSDISDEKERKTQQRMRLALPLICLVYTLGTAVFMGHIFGILKLAPQNVPIVAFAILIVVPSGLIYLAWKDAMTAVLVASVPLVFSVVKDWTKESVLLQTRTFYGVMSVEEIQDFHQERDEQWRTRSLVHGTTQHGVQCFGADLETVPMGYYHPESPVGFAFGSLQELHPDDARVGVIGLGTGAVALYNRPNDHTQFFEIDPEVARIASDPRYFTYLSNARGTVDITIGDGRLELQEEADANSDQYDLIILDAFSSDSIPVHLLTKEAFDLYFDRLTEDGILLVHISNRHLELHPVVFGLGEAHNAIIMYYFQTVEEIDPNYNSSWFASTYMALTKSDAAATELATRGMFLMQSPEFRTRMWTDQYSNILPLIK